jgi:HK97 family phage major capsid protein
MPLLAKENNILELQAKLKERAQKALESDPEGLTTEIVKKGKPEAFRKIARHEFSTADAAGWDDEDEPEILGAPSSAKAAIHEITVKQSPNGNEVLKRFQDLNDSLIIVAALFGNIGKRAPVRADFEGLKGFGEYQRLGRHLMSTQFKGLSTGGSATGLEFIPTNFSAQLIDKWRLALRVPSLFDRISMPTKVYKLPLEGIDPITFFVAENTSDNLVDNTTHIPPSTPGTANITFTAKKLALRTVWSEESDQDSIINMGDYARNKIGQALANGDEDVDINGDTAGTMDSDSGTAGHRRLAWSGLRKLTNAGAKVDFGNVDTAWLTNLRAMRMKLGKYGVQPSQLALIVSVKGYLKMLANIPEIQTLDKYGGQAVILTGELGRIDGIPIIPSEFVREDLNASGVFDNVTTDRTIVILVNRNQFMHGDRSLMTLRSYEAPLSDQLYAIAKHRLDFQTVEGSASVNVVSVGFNVKTT